MKLNINKLYSTAGTIFFIAALIFLFVHNSLLTKSTDEPFSRDILGFYVPTPPVWTSHIPYVSFIVEVVYESFSLHGLIGLIIMGILGGLGGLFLRLESKNENK